MRIRVLLLGLVFLSAASAGLFAQYSADPLEEIYDDFDLWEGAGYLTNMPPFRPYPEPVLIEALERVARVGDAQSRSDAERYLANLQRSFDVEWEAIQETRVQDDLLHLKAGLGVTLQGSLSDTVFAAGSITGLLLDLEEGELLPKGQRTEWDILDDWSSVPVAGRDVAALNQMNTSFAWGKSSLYLHSGIMRRSFGPLHGDSVVWSEQAKQSPNAVASWRKGDFRFTFALFSLTATQRFNQLTPLSEDELSKDHISGVDVVEGGFDGTIADFLYREEEYPGKWVWIQDYRWNPLSWLSLSFFESATWGPRFDLAYMVPLKWGWHAQGNAAFTDSSKMGLGANIRPVRNVQIPVVMYVDDANFNELVRLNFDSKLKMGFHTGVIWTPLHRELLRRVSLDYLAVLPYTYTHDGASGAYGSEPNYNMYTHQGEPIGPSLEPNSDRLTLKLTLRPVRRLDVTFQGRMIRHGNASEDVDGLGTFIHDGTVYDDGRYYFFYEVEDSDPREVLVETGGLSFQRDLRFLTQDNIEHTYQAGIDLSYTLPFNRFRMTLSGGYQFEYIDGPLLYTPTGTTAPAESEEGENVDVVLYEVTTGDEVVNHYVEFTVKMLY
ncbi:MAG: hypothetical protein ACLFNP_12710 [Spirochaetaceae bacterium]